MIYIRPYFVHRNIGKFCHTSKRSMKYVRYAGILVAYSMRLFIYCPNPSTLSKVQLIPLK